MAECLLLWVLKYSGLFCFCKGWGLAKMGVGCNTRVDHTCLVKHLLLERYMKHLFLGGFVALFVVFAGEHDCYADPSTKDVARVSGQSLTAPFAITAFSLLGRTAVRRRAADLGGEFHLDQELHFGRKTPWSVIFGGSIGDLSSHEGKYWLYGGNAAIKRDLDVHGDHGLEFGASIDVEVLRPGHAEYGEKPTYVGPYAAYTWEFSHRFFAAVETGVAFRVGASEHEAPHVWGTVGLGVNALMFLLAPVRVWMGVFRFTK